MGQVGGEGPPEPDSQATTIPWGPRTPTTSEDSGTDEEAEEQDAKRPRTTENAYRFSVLVEPLLRDPLTVWVQPYTQVLEVKGHLFTKTQAPPRSQRLIFLGRQLADEETMSRRGAFDGCVLFLVLSLQGGGGLKARDGDASDNGEEVLLFADNDHKTDPMGRPWPSTYVEPSFENTVSMKRVNSFPMR